MLRILIRSSLIVLIAPLLSFAPSLDVAAASDQTGSERTVQFSGMGLVTGLKGTGDGKDFPPLQRIVPCVT
jgi:flagellar basal body P-ring protein FlgI